MGNAIQRQSYQQRSYTPSRNTKISKGREYKKKEIEKDGFVWYEVHTSFTNYGALDENGRSIIPRKYDLIFYETEDEGGWFKVCKDGKDGAYTRDGRCITEAKYKHVYYNATEGFVYMTTDGERISTGIGLDGNRISQNTTGNNTPASNYTIKEESSSFFSTYSTHDVEAHSLISFGPSGVSSYKRGETTLTVTNNEIIVNWKDGSKSKMAVEKRLTTISIWTSDKRTIEVPACEVIYDKDKVALRAVRIGNGQPIIYEYIYNYNINKYVLISFYSLFD